MRLLQLFSLSMYGNNNECIFYSTSFEEILDWVMKIMLINKMNGKILWSNLKF